MPDADSSGRRRRVAAVAALLAALAGLLVWGGTVAPDPSVNDFPDEDEVGPAPGEYVGERVKLGGTVVGTDPVVVRVPYGDESMDVALQSLDRTVERGDSVTAFGTLRGERTLAVEGVVVSEPWEMQYMYVVSFLGGLWVFARIARQWRFDREQLAVVPRGERRGPDGDRDA
ncbi:hypothetical protein G9464_03245 [Halostella sp. JP-L12]|uniref:hypothetical protein n=1 Tax=Halostella TaxID=1843185 RepID=UPI000EF7A5B5|nr:MULTISPECIES: hypothetical protein [Halostella]NHN46611.1 hypothetical protein [Halostella sp. JP-L12]